MLYMENRKLSKYRDYTVLENVDDFHKRKFDLILDMSGELQKLNKDVSQQLYSFQPLMKDIWLSFYIENPELKKQVYDEVAINKEILSQIMNDESYKNYRSISKMDELSSAIATLIVGKKVYEWVQDMKDRRKKIKELSEKIQEMEEQTEEHQENLSEEEKIQQQQQLQQYHQQLHKEFQKALKKHQKNLVSKIQDSIETANTVNHQVFELLGNGHNKSELQKVPLRDRLNIAELLSTNLRLQQVAEWAGRLKSIALKKQKSKHEKSINPNGIAFGSEVENILPSEWLMYAHPTMKMDFLRRFVEGQTLQYNKKDKEVLGKGPIVCCLDQSGSMDYLDAQAKGFLLALLLIAKKQRRDFAYIPFDSSVGKVKIYEKGKISTHEMVQIANEFLGGGTDFSMPLRKSIEIINQSKFKKADVIFITDGEDILSTEFLNSFNQTKKEKDFQVISLVLKNSKDSCELFSDKTVSITDFTDENAHVAFEI